MWFVAIALLASTAQSAEFKPIPVRGESCVSALSRGIHATTDGIAVEHFTALTLLGREVIATQQDGQIQFFEVTPTPTGPTPVSEFRLGPYDSGLFEDDWRPRPDLIRVLAKSSTVVVIKPGVTEIFIARAWGGGRLDLSAQTTVEKGATVLDLDQTGQHLLVANAEQTEVSLRSVELPRIKMRTWRLDGPGHSLAARFAWDEDRMVVIASIQALPDPRTVRFYRANRDLDALETIGALLPLPGAVGSPTPPLIRSADGAEVYFGNHRIVLGNPPGQLLQADDFHAGLTLPPLSEQDMLTPKDLNEYRMRVQLQAEIDAGVIRMERQHNSSIFRAIRSVARFFRSTPTEPTEEALEQLGRRLQALHISTDKPILIAVSEDRSHVAIRWMRTSSLSIVNLSTGKTLGAMSFANWQFPSSVQFSEDNRAVYLGIPQSAMVMPNGGLMDIGFIAAVRRWEIR